MMKLDFWIFGSGKGFGAPVVDGTFYWLVDRRDRGEHGRFYTWIGGFGAQLFSFEWRCPRPGTQRYLNGRHYTVFSAERRWGRWRISWSVGSVRDAEELREIQKSLPS